MLKMRMRGVMQRLRLELARFFLFSFLYSFSFLFFSFLFFFQFRTTPLCSCVLIFFLRRLVSSYLEMLIFPSFYKV